jgi:hypothetical protein
VRNVGATWQRRKKSRATRCDRVALFSIESRSSCFPIKLFGGGAVLPAPSPVNWVVKRLLPGSVHEFNSVLPSLHPWMHREAFASASFSSYPVWPVLPRNSAAKPATRPTQRKLVRCLAVPSFCIESWSFPSRFNSVEARLGFTLAASLNWTLKFALLIQL